MKLDSVGGSHGKQLSRLHRTPITNGFQLTTSLMPLTPSETSTSATPPPLPHAMRVAYDEESPLRRGVMSEYDLAYVFPMYLRRSPIHLRSLPAYSDALRVGLRTALCTHRLCLFVRLFVLLCCRRTCRLCLFVCLFTCFKSLPLIDGEPCQLMGGDLTLVRIQC